MGGNAMDLPTIFVIITSVGIILVAYLIPKKLKRYELYATSLFAIAFGLLVDTVLAVKYKLYILDDPGVQIPPLIGQVILYAGTNIMVLNLYPFDKPIIWRVIHIVGFTIFALLFEFISFKVGFIKYNEWNLWYSALCYPFLTYLLVWHYTFFRKMVSRN
jgi:hypothetical protein